MFFNNYHKYSKLFFFVYPKGGGGGVVGVSVASIARQCPAGFLLQFGQSCYKVTTQAATSAETAKTTCETYGANLTSINDADENTFISGKLTAG